MWRRFVSSLSLSLSLPSLPSRLAQAIGADTSTLLGQIAADFIESVVTFASQLAKHRKSDTLEVKDVALHLGTFWLALRPR